VQKSNEVAIRDSSEIGFAWDEASHSADGVFDAAFLPGGVGIAEEGFQVEAVKAGVAGELGAIVECDCLAQL
jgi:hypothetical protein